jgi:glycosyltransferase involved in cell wall biosynthesis
MSKMVKVSVIIPEYNEEGSIRELHKRLTTVLKTIGDEYEIIFVDDGSTDGSQEILKELHSQDPHLKAVFFMRNFGQTAALNAGFKKARGEVIITLDADLQNEPEDIPLLLEELERGFDVVSGWRYNRSDPLFSKKVPSMLSNTLTRLMTGSQLHDSGCSLKAYRREALKDLHIFGEMHRFIPVILHLRGFRVSEIRVSHKPRVSGKTKYNVFRILKGLLDLSYISFWSSYSTRPLHFFGGTGFLCLIVSAILFAYKVVYQHFIQGLSLEVGPLLLLSTMLPVAGLQFIIFGFLAEIQIRLYYQQGFSTEYEVREELM